MTFAASDYSFVTELVGRRSAVMLGNDKQYLVESRLAPVARDLGHGTVGELITQLRRTSDHVLATRVVDAMTTKETSFFRDLHPFSALREHVLPRVIEKERLRRRLRLWSAACSTGQELYTIAMIIDQMADLKGWDVTLHGTDLSAPTVLKARAGRYSGLEVNRGLPAPMLVRYFDREGLNYRANAKLRSAVTFAELNLIEPWPTTALWDVVFLRNVLIYFDPATKRRVLESVRRVISPGGFLILGGAETTLGLVDCFSPVQVGATTVYRTEAP